MARSRAGRPNVYASIDLGPSDKFMTLTGHMDTVDIAANWPTDPFDPVLDGDRLYGLGSMDMKAGCVCSLTAFKALLEATELHGTLGRVGLAFTVDEEGYGIGAKALLETEYASSDAMLLGEPYFGCEIGGPDEALPIGLTGKVLYKLTVTGRMAHAFYPERGVNAVEDAGKILAALDQLKIGQHPEFGSGNYSTLKVDGGYKEYAVVVPETCEIIISRLTVPGETRATAMADMRALIDSLDLACDVTIETPPPFYEPYALERDTPLMHTFIDTYREVVGQPPQWQGPPRHRGRQHLRRRRRHPHHHLRPCRPGRPRSRRVRQSLDAGPVARIYAETTARFLRSKVAAYCVGSRVPLDSSVQP